MNTITYSGTRTFDITHARHLASKVVTDLKRIQRFYDSPSDFQIDNYQAELIELLKNGFLSEITYGFKQNGNWIEPTLRYTARELINESSDDDPGRVRSGANISGASFGSFLNYSATYNEKASAEQEAFNASSPIKRTTGGEPSANGYFASDKAYSAGSRGLDRSSLKSY